MKRVIFIVHSSEIVRCGLSLILRKYFNTEVIQLASLDELNSYTRRNNSNIILFMETQSTFQYNLINKLKNNNVVHLIGITSSNEEEHDFITDLTIDLLASGSTIQQTVSEILNSNGNQPPVTQESSELTPREKDVLKLVASGNTNKEIADQLFISFHTVISHRKNITEKLGIKSISGLTVYAILNKLIDTDTINPEDLI